MIKLDKYIPSNTIKIIELYNRLSSGILITDPDFQRNLVWRKSHKYNFIETILNNYPFPEIYIASSEMDIETLESKEVVVDGQQRLNSIMEYIKSEGDFKSQRKVKTFKELTSL